MWALQYGGCGAEVAKMACTWRAFGMGCSTYLACAAPGSEAFTQGLAGGGANESPHV